MPIKNESNIWTSLLKQIREANIKGNKESIIKPLKDYIKKNPKNFDAQVELIAILYHSAYDSMNKIGIKFPEVINYKKENDYVLKAIELSKKVINDDKKGERKATKNARVMLAQIYSMLNNREGLVMSKKNYDTYKEAWLLERYATNHLYFNEWKKAVEILKENLIEVQKEGSDLSPGYGKLVVAYSSLGKKKEAYFYFEKLKKALEKEEENSEIIENILKGMKRNLDKIK